MKELSINLKAHWPYAAAAFLLTIFLAILVWALVPYVWPHSSSGKLSVVGQSILVSLNLVDPDKKGLVSQAENLGIAWQGEDFTIGFDNGTVELAKTYLPIDFGLTAGDDLVVTGGANLPLYLPDLTGAADEFLPQNSAAVLKVPGLQQYYDLAGRELFQYLSSRGSLGVVIEEAGVKMVAAFGVRDEVGLRRALAQLKDTEVELGEGYSGVEGVAAGFSEGNFEGVTTYTLSQPGLFYQPTFGRLGDHLVIASSVEAWQEAKKSWEGRTGLTANERYMSSLRAAPVISVGSVYLDLEKLTSRGTKLSSDLAPFFKLELTSDLVASGLAGEKLGTVMSTWMGLGTGVGPARFWVRTTYGN